MTYVEQESNPFFGVAALVIMVVFGFMGLILVPIGYLLTLSAVHRCSRCLQRLGEKQFIGMPEDFKQPVWHIRLGKCSIVTARMYAIIAAILLAVISCTYVYMRPNYQFHEGPLTHHNLDSTRISTTWQEYLVDCGGEKIIENSVHTKIVWNDKYENQVIEWQGFFADVKYRNKGFLFPDIEPNILVKMEPSESTIFADLVLTVPSSVYKNSKQMIDDLKKGTGIKFVAVVQGLGTEFKMHHLRAIDIQKTGNFKILSDIVVRDSALP